MVGIQGEIPRAEIVVTGALRDRTDWLSPDRAPYFMAAAPMA